MRGCVLTSLIYMQLSNFPSTTCWRDYLFPIVYSCLLCWRLIDWGVWVYFWALFFWHQYFELLFLFDAPEIFPRWTIHYRKCGMSEKDVFPLQSEKRAIMNGQVRKGGLARFSSTGTFSSRQMASGILKIWNCFKEVSDSLKNIHASWPDDSGVRDS